MTRTPAQEAALAAIADRALYVGRDPGRPDHGAGIRPATLRALLDKGLVTYGPYEPTRGRRLIALGDTSERAKPSIATCICNPCLQS